MTQKAGSKKTEKKTSSKKTEKKTSSKKTEKKATSKKKASKKIKIYCGIEKPIPTNYRLGSMEECLNAGKVNYYGVKKIDSKLIEAKNKMKEEEQTKSKLQITLAGLIGKESRLRKNLADAKTIDTKEKIQAELEETKKERSKITEKISKLK